MQKLKNKLEPANQQLQTPRLKKELISRKNILLLFLILPIFVAIVLTLRAVLSAKSVHIQLPEIFSNHMILQRDQPAVIWGKAKPLCSVTLTLKNHTEAKFTIATVSDINGNWKATLPPVPAGSGYQLLIKAIDCIQLDDISFGDIFLMLGQSNMIMPMSATKDNAAESLTDQSSEIRWFKMKERIANKQDWQTPGSWKPVTRETINDMPAVPYYFSERLNQKSAIPIGLVISGCGGSPINAWLMPKLWQSHKKHYGGWRDSSIFNTMLAPVIGLKIKGIIWYQGEANICNGTAYGDMLTNFITSLRNSWKTSTLPVFIVQLPAFGSQTTLANESPWAEIREEQAQTASDTNSSLIVTLDTSQQDEPSIHPTHKLELGQRIADTVFTQLYLERKDIFPSYESSKVDNASIVLSFKSDSALVAPNNDINVPGFTIAGPNKQFIIAQAKLDPSGKQIIVSNPSIEHPCAVRYGWSNNPITSLQNQNRQPVIPFRTDTWQLPHH